MIQIIIGIENCKFELFKDLSLCMSLQNTIISFWEVYILIVKNYGHISKKST